jgi:hypothetical protein
MSTRYARRRVFMSLSGFDEPQELIILKSFKDCGQFYYRCKVIDSGAIIDVQVRSVDYLLHRKSRVKKIKPRVRLVR